MHRRVERIQYLDDRSVRRKISIDFTVPSDWPHEGPLHLPVAQFLKESLTNFDFVDEAGQPIPMLTAEENGAITTTMLQQLARIAAPDLVDFIVDERLASLVACDPGDEALQMEAVSKIFQEGTTLGATLLASVPFRSLTSDVMENFLLYLPVLPTERGRRRIIKLSFDRGESVARPRRALEWLGITPVEDTFLVPAAGFAASYHVEVEPPTDMRLTRATFFGFREGELDSRSTADGATPSTHINMTRLDRGLGFVTIAVRAESAVLISAALYSCINAAALGFVLYRLSAYASERSFDAVVAVLLAVPGAALAFIVRPSEHRVVSAFLRAIRGLALLAALTSFVAAMVLFAGYKIPELYHWYRVLVPVAGFCAVSLTSSWIVQAVSSGRRRSGTP